MKKTTCFRFMAIVIALSLVVILFRNCKSNVVNQNKVKPIADGIVTNEQLLQKEYEQSLINAREFERVIVSETEIVLVTLTDSCTVYHSKMKDEFLNWLISSSINLDIVYTAIVSIPTNALKFVYDEEKIAIYYDLEKINIKSIEINGINAVDNYGILAKKYTPSEVSALTMLATDFVRKEMENDIMLDIIAEQNLTNYLRIQAIKFLVFDVTIKPIKALE